MTTQISMTGRGLRGRPGPASGPLGNDTVTADHLKDALGERQAMLAKLAGDASSAGYIGTTDGPLQDVLDNQGPYLLSRGFLDDDDTNEQNDEVEDFLALAKLRGKVPMLCDNIVITRTILTWTTIAIHPDATIRYDGPDGSNAGAGKLAFFEPQVDGIGLTVPVVAGRAQFVSTKVFIYAWRTKKNRTFLVNVNALGCNLAITSWDLGWSTANTDPVLGNVVRGLSIIGGDARYGTQQTGSQSGAQIALFFCFDVEITGTRLEKGSQNIQWWGGNSAPAAEGAEANERKCGDFLIRGVRCYGAGGGNVWGSMGRNIRVEHCYGEFAIDLCFDAEGCWDVTFSRCVARYGKNACFATFHFNKAIKFYKCEGTSAPGYGDLFKIWNASLSASNREVTIDGGRFEWEGVDTYAQIGTMAGPVEAITVINALFVNVRASMGQDGGSESGRKTAAITIKGNEFRYTYLAAAAFSAIWARAYQSSARTAATDISDNRFITLSGQPTGTAAVHINGGANFGGTAIAIVERNYFEGWATIVDVTTDATSSVGLITDVSDNISRGTAAITESNAGAISYTFTKNRNRTVANAAI